MKRALRAVLIAVLLVSAATAMFGQTKKFLARPTTVTYLNQIILGDTLGNGQRADSSRIYVLQRGGIWFWENIVQNAGWTLHIEANDTGSGTMPEIYGFPTVGGTAVPYQFTDTQGPIYIKGLQISGYYDLDTSAVNAYGYPFIFFRRATAGAHREEYYGNVFSNSGQAYVSAFAALSVLKFVDNKFANDCVPPGTDVGNGRITDIRNVSLDSVVLVNNTLTNGFDRAIRHLKSVGRVGVYLIDHNTFYENGGRYGLFSLGAVGSNVTFTNNLLVDPMGFGSDTMTARQFDFGECQEFYADGKVKMAWLYHSTLGSDTLPGKVTTNWNIKNNYYYITPQVQAVYDSAAKMGWDPPVTAGRPMTDNIKSKVADTTKAFIKLASFGFTLAPKPMDMVYLWAIKPASVGGTGGGSSGGVWPGYDKHLTYYYRDTMNLAYSTSSAAYTGGSGGFPVGDLNWFPSKKSAWLLTGVEEKSPAVAETYTLSQNYPNPFNPSTRIDFAIPKQSQVTIQVFNVLGQEVATLANGVMGAGQHSVTFNASKLASGVYFYTINAGSFTNTRKMMLLK